MTPLCLFLFCAWAFAQVENTLDIPVLQITDVHGWINGHPRDLNKGNATLGDFQTLMDVYCADRDCITIDSGDQVEGTGYSDASNPPGSEIYPIFDQLGLTALTVGNHDLFDDRSSVWLHEHIAKGSSSRRPLPDHQHLPGRREDPFGTKRWHLVTLPHSQLRVLFLVGWMYNFDNLNTSLWKIVPPAALLADAALRTDIQAAKADLVVSCATSACAICSPPSRSCSPRAIRVFRQVKCPGADAQHHQPQELTQTLDPPPPSFSATDRPLFCGVLPHGQVGAIWQWSALPQGGLPIPTITQYLGSLVGADDIRDVTTPAGRKVARQIDEITARYQLDTVEASPHGSLSGRRRRAGGPWAACMDRTRVASGLYSDSNSLAYFWLHEVLPEVIRELVPHPGNTIAAYNTADSRADLPAGKLTRNDLYMVFPFDIPLWEAMMLHNLTRDQLYFAIEGSPMPSPVPAPPATNPHYALQVAYRDMDPTKGYDIVTAQYNIMRFVRALDSIGVHRVPDALGQTLFISFRDYLREHYKC
ncbi:hypothetical protein PAPYR_3259 [Paratrimastix pyriformis]|uniref:Calcineurin-like phosphoesterase domain-containing protein n=1 Tax=Paratrimastix pyriformis TaxID=342808 RepID=A0ABQ8UN74_9EUKA|nr:hypothetical protein PAPYR_3259 [Paratrimastix pyriformis]